MEYLSPMDENRTNKRFIAGAVCPACNGIDKIYTYLDEQGAQWRACTACEFRQSFQQYSKDQSALKELPTRVNQNRLGEAALAHETPVEAVRLMDPKEGRNEQDK